jgi:hypothetical protein
VAAGSPSRPRRKVCSSSTLPVSMTPLFAAPSSSAALPIFTSVPTERPR